MVLSAYSQWHVTTNVVKHMGLRGILDCRGHNLGKGHILWWVSKFHLFHSIKTKKKKKTKINKKKFHILKMRLLCNYIETCNLKLFLLKYTYKIKLTIKSIVLHIAKRRRFLSKLFMSLTNYYNNSPPSTAQCQCKTG